MTTAALYCRFSSDKQREASIEDQARKCRRLAEREGWSVVETYSDEAISGSRSDRPAYQRMLAAAKARTFDILLVDDLSRLSRDQVESERTIRQLEFWGVRLIALSDGYDSESKGRKVHRTIKGLMNEIYLDDLADKTHRGLEGQALHGYWTGGRPFGYRLVPVLDQSRRDAYGLPVRIGTRLAIEPAQAVVVRRIFKLFAAGHSPRAIAEQLNADNVPPPGAAWKRGSRAGRPPKWLASAIYGNPKLGSGILRNALYGGVLTWNRSRWVRNPETKRREYQLRADADHVTREAPELRIVPDELWKAVRERQQTLQASSIRIREALHRNARTGRSPKYLLSGLLQCGVCGSNFVMNGTRPYQAYACASRVNGGKHACWNTLRVPKTVAEHRLLGELKQELLRPENVAAFKREVRRALDARRAEARDQHRARRERLQQLEIEIERLVEAIASGLLSPALKAKLEAAESERAMLAAQERGPADRASEILPRLADTYRGLVDNLETALQRDVNRARHNLTALLGRVRLTPSDAGDHLIAEGEMNAAQLLAATGPHIRKCGSGGRI